MRARSSGPERWALAWRLGDGLLQHPSPVFTAGLNPALRSQVFAGQRVLVVGAGESGSDICNEIAQHAAKVAIVVRGKHGHLIPRKQADGRVTDLNTNRVRYSNP